MILRNSLWVNTNDAFLPGSASVSLAVFGLWPKTSALDKETEQEPQTEKEMRMAGGTPAKATGPPPRCFGETRTVAVPHSLNGQGMAQEKCHSSAEFPSNTIRCVFYSCIPIETW
jgi:hypothetical protein